MATGSSALMAAFPTSARLSTLAMKLAWLRATSARFDTRPASMVARSLARTSACCETLLVSTWDRTPESTRTTVTSRMAAAAAMRVASDRRAASHRDRPTPQPPRKRRKLPKDSTSLRMAISATTRSASDASRAVRGHRAVTPRHPMDSRTTAASRRLDSHAPSWPNPPWTRAVAARSEAAPARMARNSGETPSRSDRSTSTNSRLAAARKTTRSAASETIEVEVLTRPSAPRRRPTTGAASGSPVRRRSRTGTYAEATGGLWPSLRLSRGYGAFAAFAAVSGAGRRGGARESDLAAAQPVQGGEGLGQRGDRDDLHLPGEALGVLLLVGRDEEGDGPRLAGRHGLLGHAAARADLARCVDGAGDGDVAAAVQLALGQVVDQRQREGQPGRRA